MFEVVLPVVDGHRVVVPPEAMDERLYISGGDNCQCYISCDRCTCMTIHTLGLLVTSQTKMHLYTTTHGNEIS